MLENDMHEREGGQFVLLDDKKYHSTLLFKALLRIPASFLSFLHLHIFVTRLHLRRPSVLYLEFFLTIFAAAFTPLFPSTST